MRKLLMLMILPILLLTGCAGTEVKETADGRIPTRIVFDGKDYFDFNITIAYEDRVYAITDEFVKVEELDKPIGRIDRDVTSHALINGDYGFYTAKKPTLADPYYSDTTYQQMFDNYNKVAAKGFSLYKLKGMDASKAIALKYGENHFRKFVFLGGMNSFNRIVEHIIRPIVFVPLLVAIFLVFLVTIVITD